MMPYRATAIGTALLLNIVLAASLRPEQRPYLAVIEKAAGAVGFFTEDGNLLWEVKVGSFPHEAVMSDEGRLYSDAGCENNL